MTIWYHLGRLLAIGIPVTMLATTATIGYSLLQGLTWERAMGLGLTLLWFHIVVVIASFRVLNRGNHDE